MPSALNPPKNFLPLLLLALGILIFCGGFTYDILYAGIPYQDPTPQLTAHYNRHARIATLIRLTGLTLAILAALPIAYQHFKNKHAKPETDLSK